MSKSLEDPLEALLAIADTEFDKIPESYEKVPPNVEEQPKCEEKQTKNLTEFDLFGSQDDDKPSVLHNGDTDSSEDEDNRNFQDQKYNDCGKQIRQLLTTVEQNHISSAHYRQTKKRVSTWKDKPDLPDTPALNHKPLLKPHTFGNSANSKPEDVLIDPFFGIKIINPLISHSTIVDRMQGREPIQISAIQRFLTRNSFKEKDWVVCGVIVGKSPVKTSQKGSQYSIWTLSDLKNDIKTVGLFLFSSAHKDLWKLLVGSVIGVLNPGILDKRDNSKDEATLSVDNAQKVMVFGQSKDYGVCKSLKKNGEKCNAIVNKSTCEYCIYHIRQEYQKCSRRSELQANFAGKGLTALRNKVLGKNEVFYAGKSFMAIPAKKSKKMTTMDEAIMNKLSGMNVNSNSIVKVKNITNQSRRGVARHLDVSPAQRSRDIELLKKLGGGPESKTNFSGAHSSDVSLESSKSSALSVINKLKARKSDVAEIPRSSQYNLKSDLLVNVQGKKNFSGKMSEDITLKESKSTALSVISKLKAQNALTKLVDTTNTKENEEEQQNIEELLASFECDEFNYDDDDDFGINSTKANKVKYENIKAAVPSDAKLNICSPIDENSFEIQKDNPTTSAKNFKPENTKKDKTKLKTTESKSVLVTHAKSIETYLKSPKVGSSNSSSPSAPKIMPINENKSSAYRQNLKSTPKSLGKNNASKNGLGTPISNHSINLFFSPKFTSPSNSSANNYPKNKNITQHILKSNSKLAIGATASPENELLQNSLKLSSPSNNSSQTKSSSQNILQTTPNKSVSQSNSLSQTAIRSTNSMIIPTLSGFSHNGMVDLNIPVPRKHVNQSKLNAISFIQKHGPIKKADPNSTRGTGKKRPIVEISNTDSLDKAVKKSKLQESEFISDRWKKMMAASSKHQDLIEQHYDEEKEKYFKKLEVKEKMEEKMTNTFKIACKAVTCLKCKYTSFSASDLCKIERHPLKVFDAMKRFFKCGNCQNRIVVLEIIPTRPCNNCGSGKWERTGMMKEKVALVQHSLSIRGGEQKFVNSNATDASLDLLVPEEGT